MYSRRRNSWVVMSAVTGTSVTQGLELASGSALSVCGGRSAKPKAVELEDALEVGEQHHCLRRGTPCSSSRTDQRRGKRRVEAIIPRPLYRTARDTEHNVRRSGNDHSSRGEAAEAAVRLNDEFRRVDCEASRSMRADAPFSSVELNNRCNRAVASRTTKTPDMWYYSLAPPRPHCGVWSGQGPNENRRDEGSRSERD